MALKIQASFLASYCLALILRLSMSLSDEPPVTMSYLDS